MYLETITPENWRSGLKVKPEQEYYVANDMTILARAFAFRNHGSNAYIIKNDDTPIGMALYYGNDAIESYILSELFIDQKYQGKGFGYQAAMLLIEQMKKEHKYNKITLCYIEDNLAAKNLYEKCGFYHTGESDGNEVLMQLDI